MVRAHAEGLIDFSKFDPVDTQWWRKLRWVLKELERSNRRELSKLQHHHWISLAIRAKGAESLDATKTNAQKAFNAFLKSMYPWLADKIGESGTQSEREQLVADYHRMFGKPGDLQYELMVDTISKALSRGKLSKREKELDLARRRARYATG